MNNNKWLTEKIDDTKFTYKQMLDIILDDIGIDIIYEYLTELLFEMLEMAEENESKK